MCEHGQGGGDGAEDPESADQVYKHILEDDRHMHGKKEDGERAGKGKGPSSPSRDEVQSPKREADEHSTEQMADDVDEQEGRHNCIAIKVRPERGKLRGATSLVDIVGQIVEADERSPGDLADQGEGRRDGGEPRRTPHAQERHAQVAQR